MTKGRNSLKGRERAAKIVRLRERDGDKCCRCHKSMDFTIDEIDHPGFVTVEHYPIPWRECRSNKPEFVKLAHHFCNQLAALREDIALRSRRHPKKAVRLWKLRWAERRNCTVDELIP